MFLFFLFSSASPLLVFFLVYALLHSSSALPLLSCVPIVSCAYHIVSLALSLIILYDVVPLIVHTVLEGDDMLSVVLQFMPSREKVAMCRLVSKGWLRCSLLPMSWRGVGGKCARRTIWTLSAT